MNNTIYRSIGGLLLVLCLTGCKKFLEEKSQDEVRPGSVAELQQLLMGEAYTAGTYSSFHAFLDLMTDDMISNFNPDKAAEHSYKMYEGPYTWNRGLFEMMEAADVSEDIDTYARYYSCIKGCNVVLEMIDEVKGDESERENVRGQALALRGFYYFMLNNLFAQPYNTPGIDRSKALGVELILSSVVKDEFPKRSSLQAAWDQVESDLTKALPIVEKYGTNNTKFRITPAFMHTLLSRFYLYQEKWDLAAKHASLGLALNSSLVKLSNIAFPPWYEQPAAGVYSYTSTEVIWLGYASYMEYYYIGENRAYGAVPFCVSPDLRSKYEYTPSNKNNRGDLRMRYYFGWNMADYDWTIFVPLAGWKAPKGYQGPVKGMRVAELYLNRAEANIMQYLKNGDDQLRVSALRDLNTLRESRYDTRNAAYQPVDKTGDELLQFCRDERRRELCFEDHRWFDLRRYGMPEIKHVFQGSVNQAPVEHILAKGDKHYVLPIPRNALIKNPALEQNP